MSLLLGKRLKLKELGIYYLPDEDKKQIYKIFEEKVRQAFKNL